MVWWKTGTGRSHQERLGRGPLTWPRLAECLTRSQLSASLNRSRRRLAANATACSRVRMPTSPSAKNGALQRRGRILLVRCLVLITGTILSHPRLPRSTVQLNQVACGAITDEVGRHADARPVSGKPVSAKSVMRTTPAYLPTTCVVLQNRL